MPTARADQIDLSVTPFYHCISRCVRRAYLCGKDAYTGQDFEHRREWVRQRLQFLAKLFAIDVCAYAILSNHLHVVVHVDLERAAGWTENDVAERYRTLHPQARADYQSMSATQKHRQRKVWRSRLSSVSWMMRALNEFIARRANKEDKVTGRFWEGRFKSQALLDEQGLLTCMAYVDLNPIRAGIAPTLEASDFTSIQERLEDLAHKRQLRRKQTAPRMLAPFSDQQTETSTTTRLPATLKEYVELLEWTGRFLAEGKRGKIVGPAPKLLIENNLSGPRWVAALADRRVGTVSFLGAQERIDALAKQRGKQWLSGLRLARQCKA